MDRTERFYKIDQLLQGQPSIPLKTFIEVLGVSRATVMRDIEYLRDRYNAPIVWDPAAHGYRFTEAEPGAPRYALPGLWFNAGEIHALLTMEHLLSRLQPGLLGPHIDPLRSRIRVLLDRGDHSVDEVVKRIRVLHMASRPVEPGHFQVVSNALLKRRQLLICHYNRRDGSNLERTVSPQRLVHYRDNWYLDAWCHQRLALRTFSVDAIERVELRDGPAEEIDEARLDAELSAGYGIFAGEQTRIARLRFSEGRARWVAREEWHPSQQGSFDEQGRYLLSVPYSQPTELLMDLLRYGPDVEVLEPESLREQLVQQLRLTLSRYG